MLKRGLGLLGVLFAGWAWWTNPSAGGWSTGSVQEKPVSTAVDADQLAEEYWYFLRRVTLGLIRPSIDQGGVRLLLLGRWSLISLGGPTQIEDRVRWPLQSGLLVARPGGYFELATQGRVEVSGLRPRLPRPVYYLIQHPLHRWLGNRFLRSL